MREYNSLSGVTVSQQKLSHAYITAGDPVTSLAMAAVCSAPPGSAPCKECKNCKKALKQIHPDIITIRREKDKNGKLRKEIVVDQIRALKSDIYISPNESVRKVYIINEAETMNNNAQNAFLLMLEDPPSHVVFILSTAVPAALLPTVRSRCVDLKTDKGRPLYSDDLSEITQLAADFISSLGDNMKLTELMFRLDKLDRSGFSDFITLAREELSGLLRKDSGRSTALLADELFTEATGMLELNVSTGHISGMICTGLMSSET